MVSHPAADTAWFTIVLNGRPDFGVYALHGREAVSEPYAVRVEVVSLSAHERVAEYVGKPACLTFADAGGVPRRLHGLVREMRRLHTANVRTHYECVLVPRLDFLKDTRNHRIFQELSVPDIIRQILGEQGFDGESFAFKCFGDYAPREYCVQYGESDFHFISRLCEEEGIYYYFEHAEAGHCLCFSDMAGGPRIAGNPVLRFFPGSGQRSDEPVIARLTAQSEAFSDSASYREWNFEKPRLDLSVAQAEPDSRKAPVPPGMALETYRFPHLYQRRDPGRRYADLRLQRQLCLARRITGESDVCRFVPGCTFDITQHYRRDVNECWWTLAVEHRGEQPGVLEHEAPDDRGRLYSARFTAIPAMTRFVPPERHPKQRITGRQTAVVTGPENEEISPDKYGRVTVRFFWDRRDVWNENSSCRLRVAQGWAGNLYGAEVLPRVGHEVIVSFLDGDPDRPIVTGRNHHARNLPAYDLPAHKTRTVFKSMSTPGEENEARGFHELRIEDKKGEEEIYLHAQQDVNAHIKNDWKEHIGNNRHRTVENFSYFKLSTGGGGDGGGEGTAPETHGIVEGPRKTELLAEDHHTVRADSHAAYESKWLAEAGEEIHLESLMKAVIEAGADLTLKVGPSFIHIAGGVIEISGPTVDINSGGSPGEGTGANPLLPEGSAAPEVPPAPVYRGCLLKAEQMGSPVVGEY